MEYEHLEQFFSTFSDRICELNLIERDVNTIHSLCISLARNLNKLNERLIIDPNGFTATEVFELRDTRNIVNCEYVSDAYFYYRL